MTYKLIVMNEDGGYQIDSNHRTIRDAIDTANNLGSKWFFYPYNFICKGDMVVKELSNDNYLTIYVLKGLEIAEVAEMFRTGVVREYDEL